MKRWLKENWFKGGSFFIFSLIGFSIAYYYIFFLPAHLKNQENHRLMIECRSLGEKIEKEINPPNYPVHRLEANPEYYYNPKLKKCFYCGGYTEEGFVTKFIIDAYTNVEIVSFLKNLKVSSKEEYNLSSKEEAYFFSKKRALFAGTDFSVGT